MVKILADKTTKVANKEQLAIDFCWVDEKRHPSDSFIGLYQIQNTV